MSGQHIPSEIPEEAVEQYVKVQKSEEAAMILEGEVRDVADSKGFDELVNVIDDDNYDLIQQNYTLLRDHYDI